MVKRTFVIISLIISVLSLIYMVLVYYGIIRYGMLHLYSVESYIKEYTKIPKTKDRVVVHFSAAPHEFGKLKPFLNSILDQTTRVDEIAVSIPYKDMGKIPKNMKKVLSVYGYSRDYDDAGKLIPVLLREKDADTKIIIVEPSIVYGNDFINEIVAKSDEEPDKMIKSKKALLLKPEFFTDKVSDYKKGKGFDKWLKTVTNTSCKDLPYQENYKCL